MQTINCEKELLILSLIEYICTKESKSSNVLNRIYDVLVTKKLVSKNLMLSSTKEERIVFVEDMLNEMSDADQKIRNNEIIKYPLANKLVNYDNLSFDSDETIMQQYTDKLYKLATKFNTQNDLKLIVKNHKACYQNFIKLETLGSGGFGTVYKAHSILDRGNYAIKKVFMDVRNKKLSYYLKEATMLAKLNHPNIIRYYSSWLEFKYVDLRKLDYDSSDDNNSSSNSDKSYDSITFESCNSNNSGNAMTIYQETQSYEQLIPVLYIQMELCDTTLKHYLTKRNQESNYQDTMFRDNLLIMSQLILALKYIHELNIIHRDITPQNIFINYTNDQLQIKLGDFGLSSVGTIQEILGSKNSIATSLYTAPEKTITQLSDVYSLGIIFFELYNKFDTVMERVCCLKNAASMSHSELLQKIKNNNVTKIIQYMIKSDISQRWNIDKVHYKLSCIS
jgi:hypothetical protein